MSHQRVSNKRLAFGRHTPQFIDAALRATTLDPSEYHMYEPAVIKANPCGSRGAFRVSWAAGDGMAMPEFNGTNMYGIVTFTRKAEFTAKENVQQTLFGEDEING
jgi:hypothetical protein